MLEIKTNNLEKDSLHFKVCFLLPKCLHFIIGGAKKESFKGNVGNKSCLIKTIEDICKDTKIKVLGVGM